MTNNVYRVLFWSNDNIVALGGGSFLVCEYSKNHQPVPFNMVNFMVCEFYLKKRKINFL